MVALTGSPRRVAAIDCGTNTVRLLVMEHVGGGTSDVERDLVITRLGEGVDAQGRLGTEPLRRTVEAIAEFAARARALDADRIAICATSAVRDAANRAAFTDAVRTATGIAPEVLAGAEEARRSFRGALSATSTEGTFIVCDIGGGSTELVRGPRSGPEAWVSMQIGCVRMTERHLTADPPTRRQLAALIDDLDTEVDGGVAQIGDGAARFIGVAGTVTTLAALALGMTTYDRDQIHGSTLHRSDVTRIRDDLAAVPANERRRAHPVIQPGREDVLVAGATILERVMLRLQITSCVVSETDILDGIALGLLDPSVS